MEGEFQFQHVPIYHYDKCIFDNTFRGYQFLPSLFPCSLNKVYVYEDLLRNILLKPFKQHDVRF